MPFTPEQHRTIMAWRQSGYEVRSQTAEADGVYHLIIGRQGELGVMVALTPNGRFRKVFPVAKAA